MKKSILLVAILLLTACQSSTGSAIPKLNTESTETQSSSNNSAESENETISLSSQQANESDASTNLYPYAVDLSTWETTINIDPDDTQTTNNKSFFRSNADILTTPWQITINLNDVNKTGKGLYLYLQKNHDASDFDYYPIQLDTIPTKEITVINDEGQSRHVQVNTVLTVESDAYEGNVLDIIGDNYYLFYNQQGGISLATSTFSDDSQSDTSALLEYVEDTARTAPTPSQLSEEDYYKLIKDAYIQQKDYKDSIADPQLQATVQAPSSAATNELTRLTTTYPDDHALIDSAFQRVKEEFGF